MTAMETPVDVARPPPTEADVLLKEMSKMPLFMQSLDIEQDDGNNDQLEAFKALAYEGEPHEVAENFKQQGNESFRTKMWKDAVEFYTRALAVKCDVQAINEACYANRAACNLELQNYRRTNQDCAEALKLNPKNVKAWYRSARACFALDKLEEAKDCVERGLECDPENAPMKMLQAKVNDRVTHVRKLEDDRRVRLEGEKTRENALKAAIKSRGIHQRFTGNAPNMDRDTAISLENPTDPNSTLLFPTIFLYPLHLQSDFVKALPETSTIQAQIEEILDPSMPPPWDEQHEFAPNSVDLYVERKKYDMHGKPGLSKVGKKVTVKKLLEEGKLEVIDGMLSVLVVPKKRAEEFIAGWKQKNPS